ncbi:MAG: glycerophosphodiester phosphodiesterase [Chloroflexota bacterium]
MKKHSRYLFLLLVLIIAILTLWPGQPVAERPFFVDNDGFLVIAHQGGNLVRPDNTMMAFNHAVELGVDVLEMDIHSSANGELVVIHDDTVDRTTDGNGRVNDLTLAELKTLDAAYDWSVDDGQTTPYRGQGVTIPALEELFQAFPDMPMNIEIKQEAPPIGQPFCDLIREYGKEDQVLVASFSQVAILEFREVCPEVATSMVQAEIQSYFILNTLLMSGLFRSPAEAFQVPEYFNLPIIGRTHVTTDRFIRNAQSLNIEIHVWTVNEEEQMIRLIDAGVDGLITDRPDLLIEIRDQRLGIGDR